MRIAYPVDWSRPTSQASQEQTINTVAALARHGAQVTVIAPRPARDDRYTAEDLRRRFGVAGDFDLAQRDFPVTGPQLAGSAMWLRRAARDPVSGAADLVLTRLPAALAFGAPAGRRFVFDHYKPWPDQWPLARGLFRRTLANSRCLGVVTHSRFAADSYRRLGAAMDKVLVAHNGFDATRMSQPLSKREARQRLGLDADRPLVVYAGRVSPDKGLDAVMGLAALRPRVAFALVGSEGQGPVEAQARALENVSVAPWQAPDALPPWLFAADVLIIPPSAEPLSRFGNCVLPLKTFLYLASGRPILAPRSPDTAELLVDGETALLVPADDAEAAASGLDRLLDNAVLAGRLADRALAMSRELTWDHRARRMLQFFDERLAAARAT